MRYIDVIQTGLDYIEDNLKTEITAEELSAAAGFSLYHYYRLFQSAVGIPVMQYVTRRRLLWTAYEMANGRKQSEAAPDYGFDTAAGLYKAFRREFGCSPSEYVKRFTVRKPYRIHLLQEEHIMISNSRIRNILKNWDLQDEEIRNPVETADGNIRDNTFFTGSGHVLKVFSSRDRAESCAAVLTALSREDLSPGAPVRTKQAELFASDGELYFMLTRRLDGEEFDTEELFGQDSESRSRYLGEVIGRLHLALRADENIVCSERDIYKEVCSEWLCSAAETAGLPKSFCEDYRESFGRLHSALPVQVIHRDPNPSNIIMKDGKAVGFIDFELTQRSIRLFDPCYAATAVLSDLSGDGGRERLPMWPRIFRGIIHGYDSVVHLSAEEKQALPWVVLSIQLICVGYFSRYEKFREPAEANTAMLRWLVENRSVLDY